MNVNQKGVIGLATVIGDLVTAGYDVFTPFSDYSPVDLIVANSDYSLVRLQVKYRSQTKDNFLEIPVSSVVNGKRILADRSKIDGWAIYCPTDWGVYYVPSYAIEPDAYHFRLSLVDSPQRKYFARDFRDPALLWSAQAGGSLSAFAKRMVPERGCGSNPRHSAN